MEAWTWALIARVVACLVPAAFGLMLLRHRWRERRAARWDEVARRHGLRFEREERVDGFPAGWLGGRLAGRPVAARLDPHVEPVELRVPLGLEGLALSLEPEGLGSLARKLAGADELRVGSRSFGETFFIQTDDVPRAELLLGPAARELLLRSRCDGARVTGGALVLTYLPRWFPDAESALSERVSAGLAALLILPGVLEAADLPGARRARWAGQRPRPLRTRSAGAEGLLPVALTLALVCLVWAGGRWLEGRGGLEAVLGAAARVSGY
ncbi:MAG: hypothetical protein AB7N76_15695 [Planctomycetota bacterium]